MAKTAINELILKRPTHFDSLMERLKEPRVRRVIEPLILGESVIDRTSDDFLYTRDLGLIKEAEDKVVSPSNQIYAEVMARALSWNIQADLMSKKEYEIPKYMKGGKIDVSWLLREFQDFWRKGPSSISEGLEQLGDYVERCKCEEGWLVMFDRDVDKSWDSKIYMREELVNGKRLTVVGC